MNQGDWLFFALGSAMFAALTAIFGKFGVNGINSNLATLIRTLIIVVMIAGVVTFRNEWQPLDKLSAFGLCMLVLSAIATGLSWLCYYRALQLGPASRVAPVDKLSVVVVILFSVAILGEPLTWKVALGGLLIVAGGVLLAI
jgi:transporter family protein